MSKLRVVPDPRLVYIGSFGELWALSRIDSVALMVGDISPLGLGIHSD
jgi:hypothetical protein